MYKYLLYLLRNKNYWKKNIKVIIDHEDISEVLYIYYNKKMLKSKFIFLFEYFTLQKFPYLKYSFLNFLP